jgi:FMN phosphatase YigB (HAD superfamily)
VTGADGHPSETTAVASLPEGFVQPDGVLALDVHGVVLNNPLPRFIAELGTRTGVGAEQTLTTWRRELRVPFWTGTIGDDEMWARLAPGLDPVALRNDLEDRYEPGPLFGVVQDGSTGEGDVAHETWLLSNHRHDWLVARLDRFGILPNFDKILVSDAIGAAKPSAAAFAHLAGVAGLVYIDDNRWNVESARQLGIDATLISDVVLDPDR